MRRLGISLMSGVMVLSAAEALSAQPIRLGSVTDSRFGTTWTLDGSEMANTRAKLLNVANFGPGGTVSRPIAITDTAAAVGSVNAGLLSNFDVFFIGYLNNNSPNAFTPAELTAFQTWVSGGGTMVITCDSNAYDAVCAAFGHPGTPGSPSINPIVPTLAGTSSPLFNGPFGVVSAINMVGTQGAFTSTVGATIEATDSTPVTPLPTVLFQQTGAGRAVLMADVDLLANGASGGPGINNQNDQFVGNVFAFAGNGTSITVPTLSPAMLGLLALALVAAALALIKRR